MRTMFGLSKLLLLSMLVNFSVLNTAAFCELFPTASDPEQTHAKTKCPVDPDHPDFCCNADGVRVNCRNGSGCFATGTQIALADGSTKAVEYLKAGDEILNPVLKRAAKIAEVVTGPEAIGLIEFGYEAGNESAPQVFGMVVPPIMSKDKTVQVTTLHAVLTKSGMKKAEALSLSDEIRDAEGNFHKISFLRRLPVKGEQTVWNFSLENGSGSIDEHMTLSNGIVTGDLFLQNQLAK